LGGPLRGEDAAVDAVEASAIGLGVCGGNAAAGVVGLVGIVDVAVRGLDRAGEGIIVGYTAGGPGVESHGVCGLSVDAFNDVDFAASMESTKNPRAYLEMVNSLFGPVWTYCPKGWPSATAFWHVGDVKDDEAMIVSFIAGQTNAGAAVWCYVGMIDAHVDGAVGSRD